MPEPASYNEILEKYLPGRDFRVEFGDNNIERCLLVAPHGGGIEPGTSEILKAVAELGGWAWYEFAGFLRQGNKEALHIPSTKFDEPTLMGLLPRTNFITSFHGADGAGAPVVYVGGAWGLGREAMIASINGTSKKHGMHATDAVEHAAAVNFRGVDKSNITNRGKLGEGVQLEFSREARNLLFPPNASREARGRRSKILRPLASAIQGAIAQLCPLANR
jgi:phage replication-related protein YjqB (UPF0714/DUF867 family)